MNKHSLFTSNFKQNIKFVIKLILVILLFGGYINWILPEYEMSYNASLVDKVNRLEALKEPKIVLLGNSNLSFGINSELIEESLGMPVVNMGLHGGLGNAFHEEMAKLHVVPGDIYILCHSGFDDNDTIADAKLAWLTIENHYRLWRIIRVKDIKKMIRAFPAYLKGSLAVYSSGSGNQDPGGVYARSSFNEYGDVALLREGNHYNFEGVNVPAIGEETVGRINNLNAYLTERGATLLVAGYPIGNGAHTVDASEFIDFGERLKEKLDCAVISNYADYMFDYSYFYDTNLHLTSEGANLRTKQLISDIQRWQLTSENATMETD